MSSDGVGRLLLSLSALMTLIGPFAADFNDTHVYNPRWPGHAKFHAGQTMSLGAVLGVTALYLLWTPAVAHHHLRSVAPSARARLERFRLRSATYCAALYWITQASAILYPGTLCVDPEFGTGCPQIKLDLVALALTCGGYVLANNAVDARAGIKDERVRT